MLKGCHKRIIQIKDTGSNIFEEAYFILKCDADKKQNSYDIIDEATAIVNKCFQSEKKPRKFLKSFIFFLIGMVTSLLLCVTIYLIFL